VVAAESAYSSASRLQDNESNNPNLAPYESENDLGNIVSGTNYHLRIDSTDTDSSLLYVNHEAKAVVYRVYRVHVPISQRVPGFNAPCLRFCPKRDTILIAVERNKDKVYFADFVHDSLAYDPKKKGILHIAITDSNPIHLPVGEFVPFVRTLAIDWYST
jgi:hypothetical protein